MKLLDRFLNAVPFLSWMFLGGYFIYRGEQTNWLICLVMMYLYIMNDDIKEIKKKVLYGESDRF